MKRFILRRWRGNGSIIPDIMKDLYYDYPKHRRRPYKLSECIEEVISKEEYLKSILEMYGVKVHNEKVIKYNLGKIL